MKVLCIGQSTYDIATIMENFPEENKNYMFPEKIESGGGQAANAACTLSKWGVETYLSSAVGSDSYGDKIKKELEINSVKLNFIESNFDKETALNFALTNKQSGSRTIFGMTSQDKCAHVKKTELDIEPDVIVMDGYEYQVSARTLNRFPNALSIMDASNYTGEVIELSKYCKYVIFSASFVENLTKITLDFNDSTTLLNAYNTIKSRYPNNEIIINMEGIGVIYSTVDEIKVMPALKVPIKDKSAMNDIFVGAFTYGLINKLPIEKALSYSIIASGLAANNYGGRDTIPLITNVINYYNQKFGSVTNVSPQG